MLSYRHIYHAGNHADVLKHFCLYQVLNYFNHKDKPYLYLDTHAGTAFYDLSTEQAQMKQEFASGIDLLTNKAQLPHALHDYLHFIDQHHFKSSHSYLGSAGIAALMLREIDQIRLFERHPQDQLILQENMRYLSPKARVFISDKDGYKGLIASLPPHSKRAVILIDPAYEVKNEYALIPHYVQQAMQRFAQGCYMIWSPMLSRIEAKQLPNHLKSIVSKNYLHVSLTVCNPPEDGFGMYGSQLFIINPPYTLPAILESVLSQLVQWLGQDDHATYQLDYQIS